MLWPYESFEVDFVRAHRHSRLHEAELRRSALCGCFSCSDVFEFKEISDWTDKGRTALCPNCGIDSVLGDASGSPITEDFLEAMRTRFFGASGDACDEEKVSEADLES